MMASDQNKKTLRAFQCREYLWEVFERMSAELDCSVDYLINESMRQYARSRGVRTSRVSLGPSFSAPPAAVSNETPTVPPRSSSPSLKAAIPTAPAAPSFEAPPASAPHALPQAPVAAAPVAAPAAPVAPPLSSPGLAPPPLPSMPPPVTAAAPVAPQPQAKPPLYILFNGQKFAVDKDEFVIGRGSKTSDFTIKDGNISRRHALVVFQNGNYYMKDLGSTNGVDFAGQRVGTKLIDEGDVFRICDYELRFTYR
jgi:hypothetical protein